MRGGLCFVVFVAVVFCGSTFAYDWSANPGDGTPHNPYQIATPEQLMAFPQGGLIGASYVLTHDIVLDPDNPDHRLSSGLPELRGDFNGAGFTIRNLTIAATGTHTNVGLFRSVSQYATVRNVNVVNASVTVNGSTQNAGILCGLNEGRIINCTVEGTLAGSITNAGGICGRLDGSSGGAISYCVADVTFNVISGRKGGICGLAERSDIHRCRAICRIVGGTGGGGICGEANGSSITFCQAQLHFTADRPSSAIGGICAVFAGNAASYLSNVYGCSAEIDIVSQYSLSATGGLCGAVSGGLIAHSSATGTIYGRNVDGIGGLIGRNYSSSADVSDCFARVDIEVNDTNPENPGSNAIGGLVGLNNGVISNAYAAGEITLNFTSAPLFYLRVGGFYGDGFGTVTGCFWDTEKSDLGFGGPGHTPPGLTGLTTAQMQTAAAYQDTDWDFEDEPIWAMEPGTYPRLVFKRFAGGSGRPDDPFLLASPQHLIELGLSWRYYDDAYALENDIDLTLYPFSQAPIAPGQAVNLFTFHGKAFSGSLDGRGHAIRNLTLEYSGTAAECVGLFGILLGTVDNLSIEDAVINCPDTTGYTGGLCGVMMGSSRVSRCRVSAAITSNGSAGGISGICGGHVSDSYFKGQIMAPVAGGISGLLQYGIIEYCYASCTFTETGNGGITGILDEWGIIRNSAWDSELSGAEQESGQIHGSNFLIDNIRAMTTTETKTAESFRNIDWSFVGDAGGNQAWRMCTDGVETPRLSGEFAQGGDFACPDGVGLADLLALADNWLSIEVVAPMVFNRACDANSDGQINLDDFSVLSENWQKTP